MMLNGLRMWLLLQRAKGHRARWSREVAQQFARSINEFVAAVGEDEFKIRYPEAYNELVSLIGSV